MRHRVFVAAYSLVAFAVLTATPSSVGAAEERDFSIFSQHNETSEIIIDYGPWGIVLRAMVEDFGPSNRYNPGLRERRTGTRISLGNTQPSWLEGNRVNFHVLEDEHLEAISEYRRELEALPEAIGGLQRLTRNGQLAYWLNLYNVTVFEQVASRYPMVTLRRLRRENSAKVGMWDQPLLRVMGIQLSLNDIQDRILIANYRTPVVIYGLFQGSVGGPNIRRSPYTDANVRDSLRLNAVEFVNSIRAVHMKGKVARASRFYQWTAAAFPGGEAALRAHQTGYADDKTRAILEATEAIETSYYDWHIADLYNGRPNYVSIYSNSVTDLSGISGTLESRTPEHVRRFYTGLRLKFREYGFPRTRVDIVDVPRNEDADGSATDGAGPKTSSYARDEPAEDDQVSDDVSRKDC